MANLFASSSLLLRRRLHRRSNCFLRGNSAGQARGDLARPFGNDSDGADDSGKTVYFHVSPSGDWWTGPSIFAAKHLQPDYVRSIPIPPGFDPNLCFGEDDDDDNDQGEIGNKTKATTSHKLGDTQQSKIKLSWEEKQELLHKIYDEGEIPPRLLTGRSMDGKDGTI
mmetsp:Transcript_22187/g.47724  ORF Transcript_22187/g.47724 Transcript_22187/m.47724 type:complete len:167 (-) Transcript_22187:275-775(-)|eukprot:CAMPEP_0172569320 /NCGR_PEP_ID=MMETSP1067-20121228/123017_1 /TAXON_ID=265564 ORGANISM="Thalassiosira punctigera, Strain Tpunct2005C2" /NCGR_SAMPLE_ID=MMETSP1067 /ASSEMBLY_ACC=CAM_ASM_000444 /LENGTH=166 /DNA_ID=CAMNT_0013361115 /DNA_START=45 /DNA_END=545 /DNA_ORIENTATION=+